MAQNDVYSDIRRAAEAHRYCTWGRGSSRSLRQGWGWGSSRSLRDYTSAFTTGVGWGVAQAGPSGTIPVPSLQGWVGVGLKQVHQVWEGLVVSMPDSAAHPAMAEARDEDD